MTSSQPVPQGTGSDRRALTLIALYYAGLFVAIWVVFTRFPELRGAFGMPEGTANLTLDQLEPVPGARNGQVHFWVLVTSLAGVIVTIIPVAWSYIVIKRRADYAQSIVHTLIILPITIAGIVLVVGNSLALAFSLAGIVAGVRFRTTLKDPKDGVYVFLAIGVGLACGVQAIGVAIGVSFVFNAVNIFLWRLDFGNIYADQGSRTGALQLGDVLAGPGSARTAVRIGDKRLLQALSPIDLREVAEKVARLEQHIASENVPDVDRKSYSLLIVHSEAPGEAQKWLEAALGQHAARWRLAEISPGNASVSILQYLVRFREGVYSGDFLQLVRSEAGDCVAAAEIRALTS